MQISQIISPFSPPVADQLAAEAHVSKDAEAFADILVDPVSEERRAGTAEENKAEPVVGNAISLQLLAEFPMSLMRAAAWPVSRLPEAEGALENATRDVVGTVDALTAAADQPLLQKAERIGMAGDPTSPPPKPSDFSIERSTEAFDIERKEAAAKPVAPDDAGEIPHAPGQTAGDPTTDAAPPAPDSRPVDRPIDGHARGFAPAPDDLAQGDNGLTIEAMERSISPSGPMSPTIAFSAISADADPVRHVPVPGPPSTNVFASDSPPLPSGERPDKSAVEQPVHPVQFDDLPTDLPSSTQLIERLAPVTEISAANADAGYSPMPSMPVRPEQHLSHATLAYPVVFQGQAPGHSGEPVQVVEAEPTHDAQPLVPDLGIPSHLKEGSGERLAPEYGRDTVGEVSAKVVVPVSAPVELATGTPMERLWRLLETVHSPEDEVEHLVSGVVSGQTSGHPATGGLGLVQAPTPSPQITHVASQLVASLTRNASGAVEIALSPEELGRVTMRIEADQSNPDRMVIMISFERPETLDLFRRHASDLNDAIRAAGLSGASIGFDRSGEDHPAAGNHHTGDLDAYSVEPPTNPATRSFVPVAGSSLDLRL